MMKETLFTLSLATLAVAATAQNTVGLLSYDHAQSSDGYTLIYPHNQSTLYLLDNCGEIVHSWAGDVDNRPGNVAKILENGDIFITHRPANVTNDPIWAGGGGAVLEKRDWDNNILWAYTLNDSTARFHHDFTVMPNGNVLAIVWEYVSEADALANGRDTVLLDDAELWPDMILEIEPVGTDSANIVWEWHAMDHLIQDFDNTKANFGVVADHPELINFNHGSAEGHPDWMHTNSIDYNPVWDQIMISVPTFDEIWIIDHSTTTAQAASHTGGLSGVGGDLMYRWGNPAAYDQGTAADQKLFYQHNARWIDDFVDGSTNDVGKISLFNNRLGGNTYSSAGIIQPIFDDYEWEYPLVGNTHSPSSFDWTFVAQDTASMYSSGLSSVQRLANNNTLICAGRPGYIFELNANDEIIWEYKTPLVAGSPATQGDVLNLNANLTFSAFRYPSDYDGFDGRDLTQKGFIELNPDTTFCNFPSSIVALEHGVEATIYPNPFQDYFQIEWDARGQEALTIEVYDVYGRLVYQTISNEETVSIVTNNWNNGLYFVRLNGVATERLILQR